ncbi:hypothetical protein like AT1G43760 [Hibiscus trionum]|uniref:HTH merR-type domain-containing protein n=1 Tax=Hibiscus trionum TaxID=183268 RepID=A0A9W7M446_HIBTR|nr:hypothetical protein like AT1G43760 [Hibiscus trionum]
MGFTLKKIKEAIKVWVKQFRAKERASTKEIEDMISVLEEKICTEGYSSDIGSEIKVLNNDLWAHYRREEREWHQKSRVKWFTDGDKNTKYFHLVASIRRNRNLIHSVVWKKKLFKEEKQVLNVFEEAFKSIYNSSSTIPIKDFNCNLSQLQRCSARRLEAPFTVDEVREAIWNADGNKAPGPDGFMLS